MWARKPYYLGPWTLRVRVVEYSFKLGDSIILNAGYVRLCPALVYGGFEEEHNLARFNHKKFALNHVTQLG